MGEADWRTNGECRVAHALIRDDSVVFDVGAREDDGLTLVSPRASYHLFEPLQSHFRVLTDKLKGRSNVFLNQFALGNENGSVSMFPDTESISRRSMTKSSSVTIQVQRLDEYCEERGVRHIDFLKIDTEGHELDVLQGGEQMLRGSVSCIQFEYGGTYRDAGITLREVFEYLGPGWYAYRILPDQLLPVPAYRQPLENYEYANYLVSRHRLDSRLVSGNAISRFRGRLLQPLKI